MKCKQCGKEFEGNDLLCNDCKNQEGVSAGCTEAVEEICEQDMVVHKNVEETTSLDAFAEKEIDDENKEQAKKEIINKVELLKDFVRDNKVKIATGFAGVVVLVVLICVLTIKSPIAKIVKYIEAEETEKAVNIYSDLKGDKKNKVNDQAKKKCRAWIADYNADKISYDEASDMIISLCEVVTGAEECVDELEELNDSKDAYQKGMEYKEKEEWSNAKAAFEDVIEEDKHYKEMKSEIENCEIQISLEHYEKAKQYEKDESWYSAMLEYEKVAEITPEEYSEALKNKEICLEKFRSSTLTRLGELYEANDIDTGAKLVSAAAEYMSDNEEFQSYKTYFEEKKAEQDRIREQNKYNTGITYNQLARNPDNYEYEYVKFRGKVLQVMTDDDITVYRIGTSGYGYYDDVLYAIHKDDNSSNRILEDDIVTVKGVSSGLYTYKTVRGDSITIPSIIVEHIER